MNIRGVIKKTLQYAGYDAVRTTNYVHYPPARRMKLMSLLGIDLIFDVGANTGQFARRMSHAGYKGRIVSFEPLSAAFRELEKKAASDPNWKVLNIALGIEDGKTTINISENSYSSSILEIKPTHLDADYSAHYTGKEEIAVCKLDSVLGRYFRAGDALFLKLDTQGYEKHVIDGAELSLGKVKCVQMEMSLVPLFEGEWLMADMVKWMEEKGFTLWSLEEEFQDPKTGQLLQVNGLFVRNNLFASPLHY